MTQIHALKVILPRAESPASSVHADEDQEMQAILHEVSDIMNACRPVYQVRSSSELKSALKKNKSQFPLLPEHRETRHWTVGRRSEGQQKSLRLSHSKGIRRYGTPQRTLETRETGQSTYLLSESTESLSRSKDLKRSNRLKTSGSKDALDADPAYDSYTPLRHKPQTLISPGSGLGRRTGLRKGIFGPADLPSKPGMRKFNKTETEARDYLEKLEGVIMHQISSAANRRLCM